MKMHQDQYREAAVHKCNSVSGRPKEPSLHGVGSKMRDMLPRALQWKGSAGMFGMRLRQWQKLATEKRDVLFE